MYMIMFMMLLTDYANRRHQDLLRSDFHKRFMVSNYEDGLESLLRWPKADDHVEQVCSIELSDRRIYFGKHTRELFHLPVDREGFRSFHLMNCYRHYMLSNMEKGVLSVRLSITSDFRGRPFDCTCIQLLNTTSIRSDETRSVARETVRGLFE